MKKVFFILISATILGILSFIAFQYFINAVNKRGALQVTSVPESKVYLNDKYIGQTPLCKCQATDMEKAGDYTIRLVPSDKNLLEFQEKITITDGVLTVVDRKFAQGSASEGAVISLTPLPDQKKSQLLVVSIPSGSDIYLDNDKIGQSPFLFDNPTESDHVLKVIKEGYNEKDIRIRTPLGYKLSVNVYLSTQDISNQPSASSSASPIVPLSPTPQVDKVTILDTPTGFLHVRESASVDANEIAEVKPGETYDLVSEQDGWFEIRLNDGKTGFISSQYASKQ